MALPVDKSSDYEALEFRSIVVSKEKHKAPKGKSQESFFITHGSRFLTWPGKAPESLLRAPQLTELFPPEEYRMSRSWVSSTMNVDMC
jgi:hypothetical protein